MFCNETWLIVSRRTVQTYFLSQYKSLKTKAIRTLSHVQLSELSSSVFLDCGWLYKAGLLFAHVLFIVTLVKAIILDWWMLRIVLFLYTEAYALQYGVTYTRTWFESMFNNKNNYIFKFLQETIVLCLSFKKVNHLKGLFTWSGGTRSRKAV